MFIFFVKVVVVWWLVWWLRSLKVEFIVMGKVFNCKLFWEYFGVIVVRDRFLIYLDWDIINRVIYVMLCKL